MGKTIEQSRHQSWIDGAVTLFPHPLKGAISQMAVPDRGNGKAIWDDGDVLQPTSQPHS